MEFLQSVTIWPSVTASQGSNIYFRRLDICNATVPFEAPNEELKLIILSIHYQLMFLLLLYKLSSCGMKRLHLPVNLMSIQLLRTCQMRLFLFWELCHWWISLTYCWYDNFIYLTVHWCEENKEKLKQISRECSPLK